MDYERLDLMETVYDAKTSDMIKKYGVINAEKDAQFIDYFITAVNKKCAEGYRFNGIVIGNDDDYLIFEKTDKPIRYRVTQNGDEVKMMHCQIFLPRVSDFPFYFAPEENPEEIYKIETGKQPIIAGKPTNAYKEWLNEHEF